MYHDGVPGDTKVTDPRMCALFIDWKTYKKIYIYIYIYIYFVFKMNEYLPATIILGLEIE